VTICRVSRNVRVFALYAAAVSIFAAATNAVILFRTGDPMANTTAPAGDLANSGWQFEGTWGGFLGTPIATHFFISANHIGNAGNSVFTFQTLNYSVVNRLADPFSDLVIWQVTETFPTFAALYTNQDEVGQHLVVIGRGTERGGQLSAGSTPSGWAWGADTHVERWGENVVSNIVANPQLNDFLYGTFDATGLTNESHLSVGDSGGAVFIQQSGVWKLAAINYAVDDLYTQPSDSSQFDAAIYDARGYYAKMGNNNFVLIGGPNPVPTGFYSTRISSKLDWIYSVIDPTGDADGNGIPNLLQYALSLNSPASQGYGATTVAIENGFLELIYRKISNAPTLTYQIEESSDLTSWNPVASQDDIIATQENVQTIKAKVGIGSSTHMFLRLRITQP
jgi:hypothetical protein